AVKTIAQGMPDCFGKPAVTNACAYYQCTRGCGCAKHPAFPAPSSFEGRWLRHHPGVSCRGNATSCSHRHCEERSDEAIHTSASGEMDCFAEPVIGRAIRWLAITTGSLKCASG